MITSPREVGLAPRSPAPHEVSPPRAIPPLSSLPAIPRTLPAGSPTAHPVVVRPIPLGQEGETRGATRPPAPTIIRPRKTETYRPLSKKYFLLRALIPVLALSLLGLGYWLISEHLQNDRRATKSAQTNAKRFVNPTLPKSPTSVLSVLKDNKTIQAETNPPITPKTLPSTSLATSPSSTPPPHDAASDKSPPPAGLIAGQIMERFLAASDLPERLPYLLSDKTPDELATTFLARPWPIAQFTPGVQIPHPKEGLIEYYFEVRFGENSSGFPRLATFLLHQYGNEPPRVLVDPLLDTIGGRLRDFATTPTPAPQDFYVIMDARVKCFDYKIPNADKKCTFFLRSHIQGKDILTAYANEQSDVRKEFDDPLGGLRWKNPIPVVLTLQWNTTEDIARPFIEVIAIKAKSWNP